MKHQRKGDKCLNCGESLLPEDNYCRICGQLNDDPNVSFGNLLFDFLSNYFSLDSRFSRSVVPFLFRPGYLTNRFIEGKRVAFANPIRLYLIISVVYFFLLSLAVQDLTETLSNGGIKDEQGNTIERSQVLDSLEVAVKEDIAQNAGNNLVQLNIDDSTDTFDLGKIWLSYNELKKSNQMETSEMIDKLVNDQQPWWQQLLIKQYIRLDNSDVTNVTSYLIKNISIMMFLLLPVFALVVKLIYIRRKSFLYFHHLIHGIHLHAYAFFILSISMIIDLVWSVDLISFSLIVLSVYIYFSFKRVYQQGYIKTALKYFGLFLIYSCIFIMALIVEVLISLLIF